MVLLHVEDNGAHAKLGGAAREVGVELVAEVTRVGVLELPPVERGALVHDAELQEVVLHAVLDFLQRIGLDRRGRRRRGGGRYGGGGDGVRGRCRSHLGYVFIQVPVGELDQLVERIRKEKVDEQADDEDEERRHKKNGRRM